MKMVKLSISIVIASFMIQWNGFAQFRARPDWLKDPPRGYLNYYLVGMGVSPNYQLSVEYAIYDAAKKLGNYYDFETYTVVDKTPVADYSRVLITLHGQKKTVFLKLVDTYVEGSLEGYKTFVLVSTPRPTSDLREIPGDFGALMRSTFIPGWGQVYKEYPERGMIFLLAEGIAFGTAAALYHRAISGDDPHGRLSFNLALTVAIGLHILDMVDSVTIEPNIQYK